VSAPPRLTGTGLADAPLEGRAPGATRLDTTGLEGAGGLLRLAVRRDRVRLSVWVAALTAVTYLSGTAMATTFPTPASIEAYARSAASPAIVAMAGPPIALDTLPGIVISKVAVTCIIATALLAILTVVRHTRSEEEEGRSEMLRATVVGRHAGSAAALVLASAASVLLGAGTAVALTGADVPASSSWLFGTGIAAMGVVFAASTLVLVQVFTHARSALGAALALLGVAYAVRGAGDVQDSWLVWLSPIGWSQATHPLGDERWWPLLVSLAASTVLAGVAVALANRRDVGAGLVSPRDGSATASPQLSGPVGLAFRLQRGMLAGWAGGLFVLGVGVGSLSNAVQEMARDNPTLERYLEATGQGSLTETYLSSMLLIMSLLSAGFAVSSALRLRPDETSGRLELLLSTGMSRPRFLLGTLVVTVVGTVAVLAAGGLGMGLSYGLAISDAVQPLRFAGLVQVYAPAVLAMAALAVLLLGWRPTGAAVAWAALGVCFVLGWLGGLVAPPRWLQELSPFWHTPAVPVDPVTLSAPSAITVVVVLLAGVGLLGLRRRDIG
jgi:ABC-2 type transport system permease protein